MLTQSFQMRIVESNKNGSGVCIMHKEEIGAADERYILSSVDSALSILNLFYEHEELGASEVGKLMGMSRSTAFRFMVTLERRGYVTKTAGGKYRLGLNLFSLGMVAYNRMELVSLVHPYLVQMAEESGETCHVAIISDGVHVIFTCYGMPLLDASGKAYAAISISGPTTRMVRHKEEHLERIAATVKAISKTIL